MTNHPKFCSDTYCVEDLLGFDKYVDTLYEMIRDKKFSTPFCIGIYGKWGTGKTSFMHLLRHKLKKDKEQPYIIPVWFNPWRYEKEEHLIVPFLKTIEKTMQSYIRLNQPHNLTKSNGIFNRMFSRFGKIENVVESNEDTENNQKGSEESFDFSNNIKEAATKIGDAAAAIAYGLKADFKLGPVGIQLDVATAVNRKKALANERMRNAKLLSEKLSSIYYDIEHVLKEAVNNDFFLIVVFIDDLDRCLPEKAMELMESIKLFLDIPGYLFIIGVAKNVIEQGISFRYRLYGENNEATNDKRLQAISPDKYLDKMIQLPFELPPIETGKNIEYINALLGEAEDYKKYVGLIGTGIGNNPRSLKRFVNFLAFTSRLAETIKQTVIADNDETKNHQEIIKKGFIPLFYIKWAIIVFEYPSIYKNIRANRHFLIELQSAAREKQQNNDKIKTDFHIPETLRKVLKEGDPFPEDDWLVERFVYLTETTSVMVKEERLDSVRRDDNLKPGEMVRIPKGSFKFGDENEEVTIDYDYWIDAFPVTNENYREFLSDPAISISAPNRDRPSAEPYNWDRSKKTFPVGKDHHPVVLVTYNDANAYCQWRSRKDKDGKKYRLPTSKEWEKAARGSDGWLYPWGDEPDFARCNTKESGMGGTTSVTKYPEGVSPHGCRDMAGNVWEWTDTKIGQKYMLRGGSWYQQIEYARCAYEFLNYPNYWSTKIGFRCVAEQK